MIVKKAGYVSKCTVKINGLCKVLTVALVDGEFYAKSSNKVNAGVFFVEIDNEGLKSKLLCLRERFLENMPELVPLRLISGIEQGAYAHRMYCFLDNQDILLGNEEFCAGLVKLYNKNPDCDRCAVEIVLEMLEDEKADSDFLNIVDACNNNSFLLESVVNRIAKAIALKDRFVLKDVLDTALWLREKYRPYHLRMIFTALEAMNGNAIRKKIQWFWNVVNNYEKHTGAKCGLEELISTNEIIDVEMI